MSFGARAVIRLDALRHNLQVLREKAGLAKVMATVKANAYGHGLEQVAEALAGSDAFAVARLEEAARIRQAGNEQPIVLLEGVQSADDLVRAFNMACEPVVHSDYQLELLDLHAGIRGNVWVMVDTGMHRLGFDTSELPAVLSRLDACPHVGAVRMMTHFSSADERDHDKTRRQLDAFMELVGDFDGDISISNSPAILGWPDIASELERTGVWVRLGISLYGISPFSDSTGSDFGLRPAMQFQGSLIAINRVTAGEYVGYKERFRIEQDTCIGVIAAGYADGYTRQMPDGAPVFINGRRVPLAGMVSMDMITVDLGADPSDAIGDVALLWGDELPVEEMAEYAGAIPYTLVCGVTHREPALYTDSGN